MRGPSLGTSMIFLPRFDCLLQLSFIASYVKLLKKVEIRDLFNGKLTKLATALPLSMLLNNTLDFESIFHKANSIISRVGREKSCSSTSVTPRDVTQMVTPYREPNRVFRGVHPNYNSRDNIQFH
jgi:hypothetical protein